MVGSARHLWTLAFLVFAVGGIDLQTVPAQAASLSKHRTHLTATPRDNPTLSLAAITGPAQTDSTNAQVATDQVRPAGRKIRMLVTAYCPCTKCCGPNAAGITASGETIQANHSLFVAADKQVLPFGAKVRIPGYARGAPVPVLDRGGAIKGNRLDVFFMSHKTARDWGTRWLYVTVY